MNLITAVYKVNRQDKTDDGTAPGRQHQSPESNTGCPTGQNFEIQFPQLPECSEVQDWETKAAACLLGLILLPALFQTASYAAHSAVASESVSLDFYVQHLPALVVGRPGRHAVRQSFEELRRETAVEPPGAVFPEDAPHTVQWTAEPIATVELQISHDEVHGVRDDRGEHAGHRTTEELRDEALEVPREALVSQHIVGSEVHRLHI